MIDCAFFEDNYLDWKKQRLGSDGSASMKKHLSGCEHCATFSLDLAALRSSLRALPRLKTSNGFEFQLKKRIRESRGGKTASRWSFLFGKPRWAAAGAGLATGIAIAVAFILPGDPVNQGAPSFVDQNQPAVNFKAVSAEGIAARDSTHDTLKAVSPEFSIDRFSQTVSGTSEK